MKKKSIFRKKEFPFLLFLFIIMPLLAQGQGILNYDTLRIDEVTVKSSHTRVISGFNVTTIDLTTGLNPSGADLASLLEKNSNIYLKSYGPGSLSTISFRGTGAAHTSLSWEGVPLSSPMSGMTDLSLIHTASSGRINIYMGAASLPMVSGAIGGLIDIVGDPGWGEKLSVGTSLEGASFGGRTVSGQVGIGIKNWRFLAKMYSTASDNNFSFESTDADGNVVLLKRTGSGFMSKGFASEAHYRSRNGIGTIRVWHQTASRGIAPPVYSLANSGTESQDDSFTRVMLSYKYSPFWGTIVTSAAMFRDLLDYRDELWDYSSSSRVNNYHFRTSVRGDITENTKLALAITNELNIVESNNFSGRKDQNNLGVALSVESRLSEKIAAHLLIRENLLGSDFLAPGMVAGFTLMPGGKEENVIKLSGSLNSRPPTMNDLYWSPGGNPDLKIERSRSLELFAGKSFISAKETSLKLEYTAYFTSVSEMIMWVPGSNGLWMPDNVGKVLIAGNDIKLLLDYKIGSLLIFSSLNYTYNLSRDVTEETNRSFFEAPQVIYNPMHTLSSNYRFSIRNYSLGFFTEYTGKRYTTTDNSEYIDPFITGMLYGSWSLERGGSRFQITGRISNLFNASYNLIQYYPMPGRSYQLGLQYNFKK